MGWVDVDMVVGKEGREVLACLRFPGTVGCVGEAYLLCEWEVWWEEGKEEKDGRKERKHKYIFE